MLFALYGVAGVFGRFPWKADEPYAFGVIWGMLERQQWLIPSIANQPFVEKPPLVYWTGALFARLAPFVPPHEGARVAILLFIAAIAAALYGSARALHAEACRLPWQADGPAATRAPGMTKRAIDARDYALLALLVMAGTLGLAEHLHKLTPDVGQLAGAAMALHGLVHIGISSSSQDLHSMRNASRAGLVLGSGVGVAFLSKGLFVPGVVALTALGCLGIPAYRRRRAMAAFGLAVLAALPWLTAWPAWLHATSPALFDEWFWDNNVGRFLGHVALGGNNVSFASRVLSIFVIGFPPLLLCGYVVVRALLRARTGFDVLRDAPAHAAVAVYLAITLLALVTSASMRDVYVLPAVPAMILLGMPTLHGQRRIASRAVISGIDSAFAGVAGALLVVWTWLVVRGDLSFLPPLRMLSSAWLPLPFVLRPRLPALLVSALALVAWYRLSRAGPLQNVAFAFCRGVTLTWIVAMSLLLPWIDTARSYRAMLIDLRGLLGGHDGCVATVNLGESEVALLDYVTNAPVARWFLGHSGVGNPKTPNPEARRCPWMLVLSNRSSGPITPDAERWTPVWTGARPSDHNETFVLYRAQARPR